MYNKACLCSIYLSFKKTKLNNNNDDNNKNDNNNTNNNKDVNGKTETMLPHSLTTLLPEVSHQQERQLVEVWPREDGEQ